MIAEDTVPPSIWWCGGTSSGTTILSNGGYQKQWTVATNDKTCAQNVWTYVPDMTSCGESAMFGHYRIPIERILPIAPGGNTRSELVGSSAGSRVTSYTSLTLAQTGLFDSRQNFIGTSFAVKDTNTLTTLFIVTV
jgi:hypothetical protein